MEAVHDFGRFDESATSDVRARDASGAASYRHFGSDVDQRPELHFDAVVHLDVHLVVHFDVHRDQQSDDLESVDDEADEDHQNDASDLYVHRDKHAHVDGNEHADVHVGRRSARAPDRASHTSDAAAAVSACPYRDREREFLRDRGPGLGVVGERDLHRHQSVTTLVASAPSAS